MGENPDPLPGLMERLVETGLSDCKGALLYSGLDTLRSETKFYLLGYNPGGSPDSTRKTVFQQMEALRSKKSDWNEYVDEEWWPRAGPGGAPLQRRIRNMLCALNTDVRSVCASNLIFICSRTEADLSNWLPLASRCWPVHQYILGTIKPKYVLCFGRHTWEFIRAHGHDHKAERSIPSGHGNWQCHFCRMILEDRSIGLVSVPHLSRYAIESHPKVLDWLKGIASASAP